MRTPASGLLAVIPANEAPARRKAAREDFVTRWRAEYGEDPCGNCMERWYRR